MSTSGYAPCSGAGGSPAIPAPTPGPRWPAASAETTRGPPSAAEPLSLDARFAALAARLGATEDSAPLLAELARAWAEPHRAYHNTDHLLDCLARLDEVPASPQRDRVEMALWFHDAVYDPRASDNEERSAAWSDRALRRLGIPAPTVEEIARLVLITRHGDMPADPAAALVCDVDLSILGREPAAYDEFERRIRVEYAWVPAAIFRAERSRILSGFLHRDPLYHTPHFRERYEHRARANLTRTIARLAEG